MDILDILCRVRRSIRGSYSKGLCPEDTPSSKVIGNGLVKGTPAAIKSDGSLLQARDEKRSSDHRPDYINTNGDMWPQSNRGQVLMHNLQKSKTTITLSNL